MVFHISTENLQPPPRFVPKSSSKLTHGFLNFLPLLHMQTDSGNLSSDFSSLRWFLICYVGGKFCIPQQMYRDCSPLPTLQLRKLVCFSQALLVLILKMLKPDDGGTGFPPSPGCYRTVCVHLDLCSVTRGGRDGMGWRMLTAVSHVIQPGRHGLALLEIPLPSRLGTSAWSHDSACLGPHWKADGGDKQHL